MIPQVWQAILNWVAQNAGAYWSVIGIGFGVWLIAGVVLSRTWLVKQDAKLIFGEPLRLKLLLGVPILAFLALMLLGCTPLFFRGGFGVAVGYLVFLVLAVIASLLSLAVLYWMLRRKLFTFDIANRIWRIERGFEFALRVEEGFFEEIKHLQLQEVLTRSKIIRQIVVVWKNEKSAYVLCEARQKREGILGRFLLFSSGLSKVASHAEELGWELWIKRLKKYEAQLGLPVAIERGD